MLVWSRRYMARGMCSKVGGKTGKLGKIGGRWRATRQGEIQYEEENLTCGFHVRIPPPPRVRSGYTDRPYTA